MKRYETLFIVQVDLPDEELTSLIERYGTIVTAFKGIIVKIEKWGRRKLAYEIKKHKNGFYVLIDFVGKRTVIEELERNFKIDDKILKFMTIMKDDKLDLAKIEEEKQEELRIEAQHVAPVTESQSPADKIEIDADKNSILS